MPHASLTVAEGLWLYRRRSLLTQKKFAAMTGVSEQTLRAMENGSLPVAKHLRTLSRPHPHYTPMSLGEVCALGRRRAQMPVKLLAHHLKRSHTWVLAMENGRAKADELVQYWLKHWHYAGGRVHVKVTDALSKFTRRTAL